MGYCQFLHQASWVIKALIAGTMGAHVRANSSGLGLVFGHTLILITVDYGRSRRPRGRRVPVNRYNNHCQARHEIHYAGRP